LASITYQDGIQQDNIFMSIKQTEKTSLPENILQVAWTISLCLRHFWPIKQQMYWPFY